MCVVVLRSGALPGLAQFKVGSRILPGHTSPLEGLGSRLSESSAMATDWDSRFGDVSLIVESEQGFDTNVSVRAEMANVDMTPPNLQPGTSAPHPEPLTSHVKSERCAVVEPSGVPYILPDQGSQTTN